MSRLSHRHRLHRRFAVRSLVIMLGLAVILAGCGTSTPRKLKADGADAAAPSATAAPEASSAAPPEATGPAEPQESGSVQPPESGVAPLAAQPPLSALPEPQASTAPQATGPGEPQESGEAPALDPKIGQPPSSTPMPPTPLSPVAQLAQNISDELAQGVRQATETAATLEKMRTAGQTDRIAASNYLRGIIEAAPDILGVSTVWQPDAYDGRDADFASKDLQNPDTGQFVVYWARGDDGVVKQAKVNQTKLIAKGSWLTPMTTGHAYVTEPYAFSVAGTSYIAATISVPILDPTGIAPGPLGVYSIDVPLHSVAAGLRSGTLPKNVRVILVNRNNILAADSDPAWQPGSGLEVPGEPFASYLIESRGDPTMSILIEWINKKYELVVAPVLFNADQRIWRLMMLTQVK